MALPDISGKLRHLIRARARPNGASGVSSTPIRGFTVLALAYPNHLNPKTSAMTAYDIAFRLCHDLDVRCFGNDPELKHFSVTQPMHGNADNEESFVFDFGPFDKATDDFGHRYTVIVRETAGEGFMLLIQDGAMAYADIARTLFEVIVADPTRENPEIPGAENTQEER
jgi:hypothetical protein